MEDKTRTRIVMLAVAGVFLAAGGYGYYYYQEQKAAQQAQEQEVPVVTARLPIRKKPVETASSTTAGDTTTAGTVKPAVDITTNGTPNTVAQVPPSTVAKTATASDATTKPPVVAVVTPPIVPPVTAPVAVPVKPISIRPTATATANPPVATQAAPAPKPAPKPIATETPPAATTTAAPTTNTVPANVATDPNGGALNVTPPSSNYPATTMEQATAVANAGKGRPEPTLPINNYLPWPTIRLGATPGAMLANGQSKDALFAMVPPPPKPKKINEKLVPPPPPTEMTDGLAGLPIDQLPVPPSRPTIGDKMRVLGVFDDKAIISFPKGMAIKNKWPRTITLGTGEQFESLTVVSVTRDGITIEEDGERTMKPIASITK